jgi:hypothetical protein
MGASSARTTTGECRLVTLPGFKVHDVERVRMRRFLASTRRGIAGRLLLGDPVLRLDQRSDILPMHVKPADSVTVRLTRVGHEPFREELLAL